MPRTPPAHAEPKAYFLLVVEPERIAHRNDVINGEHQPQGGRGVDGGAPTGAIVPQWPVDSPAQAASVRQDAGSGAVYAYGDELVSRRRSNRRAADAGWLEMSGKLRPLANGGNGRATRNAADTLGVAAAASSGSAR